PAAAVRGGTGGGGGGAAAAPVRLPGRGGGDGRLRRGGLAAAEPASDHDGPRLTEGLTGSRRRVRTHRRSRREVLLSRGAVAPLAAEPSPPLRPPAAGRWHGNGARRERHGRPVVHGQSVPDSIAARSSISSSSPPSPETSPREAIALAPPSGMVSISPVEA